LKKQEKTSSMGEIRSGLLKFSPMLEQDGKLVIAVESDAHLSKLNKDQTMFQCKFYEGRELVWEQIERFRPGRIDTGYKRRHENQTPHFGVSALLSAEVHVTFDDGDDRTNTKSVGEEKLTTQSDDEVIFKVPEKESKKRKRTDGSPSNTDSEGEEDNSNARSPTQQEEVSVEIRSAGSEKMLVCLGVAHRTAILVLANQAKQDILVQGIPACSTVLNAHWPGYTKVEENVYPKTMIGDMLRLAYVGEISEKMLRSRKFYDLCVSTDMKLAIEMMKSHLPQTRITVENAVDMEEMSQVLPEIRQHVIQGVQALSPMDLVKSMKRGS